MAKKRFVRNYKNEYDYVPTSERFETDEFDEVKYDDDGNAVKNQNPVTIKFKPMSLKELKKNQDDIVKYENGMNTVSIKTNESLYEIVRSKVFDWENVFDENDSPVKLERENGKLTEVMMDFLGDEWVTEIGNTILSVSRTPEKADMFLGNF